LSCPQNQETIGIGSSANVITKKQGRRRGGAGEGIAFPKWGAKDALFDILKIFRIFKKIITCSLHEAKITNYEPLKRVLPQKPAPPLPPHTHIVPPSLQKTDIVYSIFSGIISLLFLQKIAGIN
jgi:hypothetical protein